MTQVTSTGSASHDVEDSVGGAHGRTLAAVFQHPLSHGVTWRAVRGLMGEIGEVDERDGDETVLRLGGAHLLLKGRNHKTLAPDDVMRLRRFLEQGGWSPNGRQGGDADAGHVEPAPAIVIIIDHAGARIHHIDLHAQGRAPDNEPPQHVAHAVLRAQHDADIKEDYPADEAFFGEVALAAGKTGPIVIIGHGHGRANEARRLRADLEVHHPLVSARIVGDLVADLPHLSAHELVRLGRTALMRGSLDPSQHRPDAG